MQQRQRLIILRKTLYKDSDLILSLLSSSGEKIDCIAKGAVKSKKRFVGGVLEPLNYIEAVFAPRKNQNANMLYLNEAKILYDYMGLRADYDRIKLALYFLKVVKKIDLESKSSEVFDLLLHSLRALEKTPYPQILRMQFEIKFLFQQGVLEQEEVLQPFLTTSLYQSEKVYALCQGSHLETISRRASYEMESFFEQIMEIN